MNPIIILWAHPRSMSTANVSDSEGIRKISNADEARASAEFEALCRDAPQLRDFLDYHLPFYQQLRAHSLSRYN